MGDRFDMACVWKDIRSLRRSVELAGTLGAIARRTSATVADESFKLYWANVGAAMRLASSDYDRLQCSLRNLGDS